MSHAKNKNTQPELPTLAYSIPEVGQILRVCNDTVYKEINSGRIKTFRIGKRRLISMEALNKYIKDREDEQD